MHWWFLLKCYLVGMLAASGVGPIFILTFNRGATHGFLRGFATALGAACGDMIYFFLALAGALAVFEDSRKLMSLLDVTGGLILLFLGLRIVLKKRQVVDVVKEKKENILITFVRSFILTTINPMTVLFFMLIVVKILPDGVGDFSLAYNILSSFMVSLGSLTVLTVVSLAASIFGHLMSKHTLHIISLLTGFIFIGVSLYLFARFYTGVFCC